MSKWLFIWLVLFTGSSDLTKINNLKKEAEAAYKSKNFEVAAKKYSMLVDSMDVMDDQILLNLGNAYLQLSDSANAKKSYNRVTNSDNRKAKSIAYQQLGVMNDQPQNLEVALNYFKEALKADPSNEDARYNYEVVKKKLKQQQEQQQQNQDQNQENQDQEENEQDQEQQQNKDQQQKGENEQNQDSQQDQQQQNQQENGQQEESEQKQGENQEGEQKEGEQKENEQKEGKEKEGEQQEGEQSQENANTEKSEEQRMKELKEKLQELNISPEKAAKIFESYGNKEIQYLHQMKKRNTKPRDRNKPDW